MEKALSVRIFLIGIFVSTVILFPFILDLTLLPRFICFAACVALILYFIFRSGQKISIRFNLVILAYLFYTIFCAASVLWSVNKAESLFSASKQILAFFGFLLTCYFLKQDRNYFMTALLKLSVIIFFLAFAAALIQFNGLEKFDSDSRYLITGINGHKNLLSSFLFLNLLFLILAFFRLENRWKTAATICLTLSLVLIFLLKTKAVWLALAISVLIFIILNVYRKETKTERPVFSGYLVIAGLAILINVFFFVFLQPLIHGNVNYLTNNKSGGAAVNTLKTEEERLILWDKTYLVIKNDLLAGVGAGNWQVKMPQNGLSGLWRAEDLNYTFQRPHNDFLWILSETGILGFNLFLLFLLSILYFSVRALKTFQENEQQSLDLNLSIACMVGYCIISFFDFPKERIEHTLWSNIVLGMMYYHVEKQSEFNPPLNFKIPKPVFLMALILLTGIFLIGLLRFKGEYFTRRMYMHKNTSQLQSVIEAGNSALSFAYTLDPTSLPIHWYTGNAYATLGSYPEAQSDFKNAYQFNPFNRNVLNDLASSFVFGKNIETGKKYYEEAARISPRFDDPKLNLAALYITENNSERATFWLNSLFHDSERRSNYQKILDLQK